jgi:hypothetical protein
MQATAARPGSSSLRLGGFFIALAAVYGAALYLAVLLPTFESPDLIAAALSIDLTLSITALCWWLLVRPGLWPPLSLAAVFALAHLAAGFVLPAQHHAALNAIAWLAVPAELALVTVAVRRVRSMLRELRGSTEGQGDRDMLALLHAALERALGRGIVARLLASELAALYYALGTWRVRRPLRAGEFTQHERCGYAGTLTGLLLLLGFETLPVHLLVAQWSETAAWVLTGGSLYLALWLIGDYRAMQLRPLRLEHNALLIRVGLRWTLRVPYEQIVGVERCTSVPSARDSAQGRCLNLAIGAEPEVLLRFSAPQTALGPFGMQRRADCVVLNVDQVAEFVSTLDRATASETRS